MLNLGAPFMLHCIKYTYLQTGPGVGQLSAAGLSPPSPTASRYFIHLSIHSCTALCKCEQYGAVPVLPRAVQRSRPMRRRGQAGVGAGMDMGRGAGVSPPSTPPSPPPQPPPTHPDAQTRLHSPWEPAVLGTIRACGPFGGPQKGCVGCVG